MNNPFNKNLYSAQNTKSKILILANDIQDAQNVALSLKFVRTLKTLHLADISSDYITPDRLKQGLSFDNLSSGQFFQVINGGTSTWSTYMPSNQPKKRVSIK